MAFVCFPSTDENPDPTLFMGGDQYITIFIRFNAALD